MEKRLCWVTLCVLGLGLLQAHAFEVSIEDASNKTCIFANLKVKFTIEYETTKNESRNVTYEAPDNVTTTGSTCGEDNVAPLLNVGFGNGFSWSLNFSKDDAMYRVAVLSFTYNISDAAVFPDAKEKGLWTSAKNSSIFMSVPLDAAYACIHEDFVTTEHVVHQYWNVKLQAYVKNSTLGKEVHCIADDQTTVAPPTTTPTKSPTTAPTKPPTSAPTKPPTTTPSKTTPKPTIKPVDKPIVGNYSVSNATATCLRASMGLQLNASQLVEGKNVWTAFNINPDNTTATGTCGNETALLRLNDRSTDVILDFFFFTKQKNFHLHEVNVTMKNGSGIYFRTNANLSLWEASLGNSYLCHKEQLINVSDDLYINTFDVRVQPFGLNNGTYGTASECHLDDDSILIPIIVGAALSGLIVIIVIAYLIGRRKTYAGYQTL